MKTMFFPWLFVGFLFIGISIPLILEKVTPNRWYGFRVAKTLASESIWDAANRVAGFDLNVGRNCDRHDYFNYEIVFGSA
ncbi:MAG: SdpI family protein [Waterburya sp.]